MNDRVLTIDVYSDVICPWCYVGKRRLERALQQVSHTLRTEVVWRPFQLNPTMPQEGMDRTAYLNAKFGSLEAFKEMEERLIEAGGMEQIPFAFEKIVTTPNTFLAHRLIWYAGSRGRQDAVVDQLFKGYFEEGLNIGSVPVLVELADRAGLQAGPFLESGKGVAEVKAEESVGHTLGIRGVPYFVLDKACGISGAQLVDVLVSAIEKTQASSSATGRS